MLGLGWQDSPAVSGLARWFRGLKHLLRKAYSTTGTMVRSPAQHVVPAPPQGQAELAITSLFFFFFCLVLFFNVGLAEFV